MNRRDWVDFFYATRLIWLFVLFLACSFFAGCVVGNQANRRAKYVVVSGEESIPKYRITHLVHPEPKRYWVRSYYRTMSLSGIPQIGFTDLKTGRLMIASEPAFIIDEL